jgi:catechol 2,3-dioxygenase
MARIQGLNHLHLVVRDMDRSLRFYQDVLGMKERFRHGDHMIFLSTPGSEDLITLNENPEEAERTGGSGGIAHFGFRLAPATDLGQLLAEIEGAGGKLLRQGEHAPGVPYAFVTDPDGYVIEF